MNPMQFFTGWVAPFRIIKKPKLTKVEEPKDQALLKEQQEERRRLAAYQLEQETKRIMNGHGY